MWGSSEYETNQPMTPDNGSAHTAIELHVHDGTDDGHDLALGALLGIHSHVASCTQIINAQRTLAICPTNQRMPQQAGDGAQPGDFRNEQPSSRPCTLPSHRSGQRWGWVQFGMARETTKSILCKLNFKQKSAQATRRKRLGASMKQPRHTLVIIILNTANAVRALHGAQRKPANLLKKSFSFTHVLLAHSNKSTRYALCRSFAKQSFIVLVLPVVVRVAIMGVWI